ncbi:PLC-like phosphodiesterase, partial [Aureobasidium melanogenum]
MTRTVFYIQNDTSFKISYKGSSGSDWKDLPSENWTIEPGSNSGNHTFSMGDPGVFESDHWGWLYFTFVGDKEIPFFVYGLVKSEKDFGDYGAGLSVNGDPKPRNQSFPRGKIGSSYSSDNMISITLRDSDLVGEDMSVTTWLTDLTRIKPDVLNWNLAKLHFPGSHDAGSFGTPKHPAILGITQENWQCHDENFYGQLKKGIRYFDLRLRYEDDDRFWPRHGIAHQVGDALAENDHEFPNDTLLGQILQFIKEHPFEFLIVQLDLENAGGKLDLFWRTVFNAVQGRLLAYPGDGNAVPTVRQARDDGHQIIFFCNKNDLRPSDSNLASTFDSHIWPSSSMLQGPWNQESWGSLDPNKVVHDINSFMNKTPETTSRTRFWGAQCQLTPSFGNEGFSKNPSFSPRVLAGIMNPFTANNLTSNVTWKRRTSIISGDFFTEDLVLKIVSMNL